METPQTKKEDQKTTKKQKAPTLSREQIEKDIEEFFAKGNKATILDGNGNKVN